MNDFKCHNFTELHEVLSRFRLPLFKQYVFRGHGSSKWELNPKIYRPDFKHMDWNEYWERFCWWEREAAAYMQLPDDPWIKLAIAQHHKFVTPLLDWTENPLVAAYFAVSDNPDEDGAIYVLRANALEVINEQEQTPQNKLEMGFWYPKSIVRRIQGQTGRFTFHPPNTSILEVASEDLCRIIIPKQFKRLLRSEINFYWVNESTVYPDLDGLAGWMNWWLADGQFQEKPSSE